MDLIFFCTGLFIFGAVFGSFINVCIYRLPRKESIVSPGSRCPGCGHELRWYENVPRRWAPYVFSDRVETRLVRAEHGDSSGVRGAAWLWE